MTPYDMNDLISREALIEEVRKHFSEDSITGTVLLTIVKELAEKTPSVPAVPVYAIKWIKADLVNIADGKRSIAVNSVKKIIDKHTERYME